MRHDQGCNCQECENTSTTDTVLVGLLVIGGVVVAITTASKLIVGGAVAILVALVVRKLRTNAQRPIDGQRGATKKGI